MYSTNLLIVHLGIPINLTDMDSESESKISDAGGGSYLLTWLDTTTYFLMNLLSISFER